jgi:hypothetical protein
MDAQGAFGGPPKHHWGRFFQITGTTPDDPVVVRYVSKEDGKQLVLDLEAAGIPADLAVYIDPPPGGSSPGMTGYEATPRLAVRVHRRDLERAQAYVKQEYGKPGPPPDEATITRDSEEAYREATGRDIDVADQV